VNRKPLAIGILLVALAVRTWGAFDFKEYFEDEGIHVPAALRLGQYGTTYGNAWLHPQLAHILEYGAIRAFGDNPVGWRIRNVLLGTLTVALLLLLALELFPDGWTPYLAAGLLATDPLHVYFSRTTFMEVPVACFFLLFLWLVVRMVRTRRDLLVPAGLALGLTVSTKGYFPFAIAVVLAALAFHLRREGASRVQWLYAASALLVLPAAVYLATYLPWLADGRALAELLEAKVAGFRELQAQTPSTYENAEYLLRGGRPWEWFVRPSMLMYWSEVRGPTGRYVMEIQDPPVHVVVLPVLAWTLVTGLRARAWRRLVAPAMFVSTYALILAVRRPMFSYALATLVPFAMLMLATFADDLIARAAAPRRWAALALAGSVGWGLFLFPLTAGKEVPTSLYAPIVSHVSGVLSELKPAAEARP
jgi:dolichyl-phosphate-mannose--protein O-mannosyl transferase